MYDPEETLNPSEEDRDPQAEQPDRVSGEYRYRNGYTQRIYSDAHYVRADESTAPPRYYTPPERPVRETREPKAKKSGGFGKLIAACLVCALLGGLGGGAVVGVLMDGRVASLEQDLSRLSEQESALPEPTAAPLQPAAETSASALSASDIYDRACRQVVGITTEVTVTGFFGTTSVPVSGSGFIVTEDGYILTNYHVVEDAYKSNLEVNVLLHDGTSYSAAIVGVEEDNDVAVLKIEADGLSPAVLGDSEALRVGDTVYAVGNPLGTLEFSMTTGHVSAKDRSIATDKGGERISMFQFDAAVNHGNSGGPVYNDRGEVVGIVTAKYEDSGVEGIGFAIPANDASAIAGDLITSGYVTGKARLGVTVNTNYNEMYAQYYGWPTGAYIDGVEADSCAEQAGIEKGDIITRFGSMEIGGFDDLKSALKQYRAGDTVEIEIYHADESRTVTVLLDEAVPETAAQTRPQPRPAVNQ